MDTIFPKNVLETLSILLLLMIAGCAPTEANQSGPVASIASLNGEIVEAGEYDLAVQLLRSQFNQPGEHQHEKLKPMAIDYLINFKVEQMWMKEEGIMQDTSYRAFLEELHAENKRRSEAVAAGRIIYGPQQYEQLTYYKYLHSIRWIALKEKLKATTYAPDKEDLIALYEFMKEDRFKLPDTVYYQTITLPRNKERNPLRLVEVIERLKKEEPFLDMSQDLNLQIRDAVATPDNRRYLAEESTEVLAFLEQGQVGQISDIMDTPPGWTIVHILRKESNGYLAFEQVAELLADYHVEQRMREQLKLRRSTLDIQVNDEWLASYGMKEFISLR